MILSCFKVCVHALIEVVSDPMLIFVLVYVQLILFLKEAIS